MFFSVGVFETISNEFTRITLELDISSLFTMKGATPNYNE
jgi:hypothetical protein